MRLTILRGISGSGKSTYIVQRLTGFPLIVSADHYFIQNGVYQFDPTKLGDAHSACFRSFVDALNRNTPYLVLDNTNTKLWEMKRYIEAAQERGYEVEVIRLVVDPVIAAARNQHGVPADKVQQMQDRFEDFPGELIVDTTPKAA